MYVHCVGMRYAFDNKMPRSIRVRNGTLCFVISGWKKRDMLSECTTRALFAVPHVLGGQPGVAAD